MTSSLHIHGGLDKDRANVFVKYLPPEIDNDGLQSMFGVFGKIVSAKVMVDQETGLSLGYGFVRFSHPKEAKKAISTMSGHKINNKTLLCRLSNNLAFPEPSTNLYIKPLPTEMTEGELIEQFNTYGSILTVKIVREKGPPYERIGFVRYENVECASKAIEDKNGTKLAPNNPPLTVKYAESEMKRALRKAHALPKHIAKMNNTARSSFPLDLNLQKFANLSLNHQSVPNLVNLPLSSKNNISNNSSSNNNNLLLASFNSNNSNIDNNNNNDSNNLNNTTIHNNTYNTTTNNSYNNTNGNNNDNINNNSNNKTLSPIFDSSTSSFEPPVMSVPYYVPPNEWYYNHMPAFSNEMGYPRTHTYQVLLVPVSNVPFPVYNPRSQWQMGPNFSPGNFPPTQQNL